MDNSLTRNNLEKLNLSYNLINNHFNIQVKDSKKATSKNTLTPLNSIMESNGFNLLLDMSINGEIDSILCKKKEIIYMEGKDSKGIYFLWKGKIKTYRINDQGKELVTKLVKEGDFFGYSALLENEKYSDSTMALEDSIICYVPKHAFFDLLNKKPEVSKKFTRLLLNQLKENDDQLIELAYNSVRKRVAEALSKFSTIYKKANEIDFEINISRADLAHIVGTAVETITRTLREFKDEGLISIEKGSISILNLSALSSLKN